MNETTKECREQCGVGLRISSDKECDDGNTISGDGCSSTCLIELNYTCKTSSNGNEKCYLNTPISFKIIFNPLSLASSPEYSIQFNRFTLQQHYFFPFNQRVCQGISQRFKPN